MGRPSDPVPRDKCRSIILTFMIATSCLGTEAVTITGVQHSEISLSNHCRGSSAAAHCDPRSRITAQPRRTRECSVHHRSLHGSPLPHRPFALSDVVPSLCHQTANLTVCSPRPRSTRTSRFATAACSAFAPTAALSRSCGSARPGARRSASTSCAAGAASGASRCVLRRVSLGRRQRQGGRGAHGVGVGERGRAPAREDALAHGSPHLRLRERVRSVVGSGAQNERGFGRRPRL
jgi:hypothetical protein